MIGRSDSPVLQVKSLLPVCAWKIPVSCGVYFPSENDVFPVDLFLLQKDIKGQLENAAPLPAPLVSSRLLIPSPHSQTLTHVIPRQSQSCDLNCQQRAGLAEKSSREVTLSFSPFQFAALNDGNV